MNETIDFDLRLLDSVSAPARRAADALKKVDDTAKKAQASIGHSLGSQFEKVGFAAARAAHRNNQAFASSWAKIGMAAQKSNDHIAASTERANNKHRASFGNMWAHIGMAAEKAKRQQEKAFDRKVERRADQMSEHSFFGGVKEATGFSKIASAAFVGGLLAEGVMKIGETIVEGAVKAVEIFADGVKDAFKAAGHEQAQRIGERNTLGEGGSKEFREDAERFAKLTPFNDSEVRKLMMPMRRAGIGQDASRQAFATATDIGGGDESAVAGVIEQFKKIYTKQGIGKKQLVDLLGDVGTTIPDFYKDLGKKMHVSSKTAEKRAESGQVDPQLIMNMITAAQNKKQGGPAGTGGKRFADDFETRWKKISELPEEFYKKLSSSPSFARASEVLGSLLENLDPESPTGQRIMASVEHMFDRIVGFIGDPKDAAGSLADNIENAVGFAEELVDDFRSWADALLPSLETIEDMLFAARKMKAVISGDDIALASVAVDQAKSDNRRLSRGLDKQLKEADPEMFQDAVNDRLKRAQMYQTATGENGPINMPAVEKAARGDVEERKNQIRKDMGVTINVHPGAVVVHSAPGEDPTHAHHEAGQQVEQHVVRALEKAAQQGG